MPTLEPALHRALAATGYLGDSGEPAAATVTLASDAPTRRGSFQPDVCWRRENLGVYFKYAANPTKDEISTWQQEVWNEATVPLLWLVGPDKTEVYNGFALPEGPKTATSSLLDVFEHDQPRSDSPSSTKGLPELNALAGRLSMETGRFWDNEPRVRRTDTVDRRLLQDVAALESALLSADLDVDAAQGLIGRSIFAKYLADRQIIPEQLFRQMNCETLQQALRSSRATTKLFDWLVDRFNGDMFPSAAKVPLARHLAQVADFLDGVNLQTGQTSLFPYRFDLIPVELISSIYEQFVHSADGSKPGGKARKSGVYYTPLAAVSLILDQIMADLTGDETVLDITCGSGIFLVEALRRLVRAKAGEGEPTRAMIREALYEQVHGVDISPAAIRVAAFSLYLAALELDQDPCGGRGMRFRPIVDRTLLVGDAHDVHIAPVAKAAPRKPTRGGFDLIVGNPPFTENRDRSQMPKPSTPQPPRDRSLVFAEQALRFAHAGSRFGMVLKATPFFSRHDGKVAAQNIVGALGPAMLVNLSSCSSWLFRSANVPVVALLAGHDRAQPDNHLKLVQAHWSPSGSRGHAFDITPGDVATLHTASWKRNGGLLKAACFGGYDDVMLLERLCNTRKPLSSHLQSMNAKFSVGLILGRSGTPSEDSLSCMPLLCDSLRPFAPQGELPWFRASTAHRSRKRAIYNAPLLIVKEYLHNGSRGPRAVVAVLEQDAVFTNAFYGASLPKDKAPIGHLLAGILSSAVASWYFIMAGSTFGIEKRRLLQEDVVSMPVPDLAWAANSDVGRKVLALAKSFVAETPTEAQWQQLDEAVFDLYELDDQERQVVRDGTFRASWQWEDGWKASTVPASRDLLTEYARTFLSAVEPWLPSDGTVRMCAEICQTATAHPLRVIRFWLDDKRQPPIVEAIGASNASGAVEDVIEQVGTRFDGSLAQTLGGRKEVDITPEGDVLVVKPSARRHWLPSSALAAARTVLQRARIPNGGDQAGVEPPRRDEVPIDEEIALRYRIGYRNAAGRSDELKDWASEDPWPEV